MVTKKAKWQLDADSGGEQRYEASGCELYFLRLHLREGKTSYKYFKWEISAIQSGDVLQVGEFELKLQTCTHTNADGTSALGDPIENVETTCTEHGYTTYNCSICHSTVKNIRLMS